MSDQERKKLAMQRIQVALDQVNAAMRDAGPECKLSAVDTYRLCAFAAVGCLAVAYSICPEKDQERARRALEKNIDELISLHQASVSGNLQILIASTLELIHGRLADFLQDAEVQIKSGGGR